MNETAKPKLETVHRTTAVKTRKREPSPLSKVLPTDRLAFDKQVEILRAFAAIHESNGGRPVTNEDVGKVLTPTKAAATIVLTNPFYVDTGLLLRLEDTPGLSPSEECIAYHKACQWATDGVGIKLRSLLEKTWFAKALIPHLQLNSKPTKECVAILAEKSNASTEHEQRLTHLLRFLELARIIKIEGNIVSLEHPQRHSDVEQPPKNPPSGLPSARNGEDVDPGKGVLSFTLPLDKEQTRKITITAPLDVTAKEVKRIKQWLEVTLLIEGSDEEVKN